jgi:hypothetical protein
MKNSKYKLNPPESKLQLQESKDREYGRIKAKSL